MHYKHAIGGKSDSSRTYLGGKSRFLPDYNDFFYFKKMYDY